MSNKRDKREEAHWARLRVGGYGDTRRREYRRLKWAAMSQEAEALRSGPRTPPTLTGREKEEHAQAVVKYAPWLVDLVLKGPMWLSDAYEVAKKWQQQYEEDAAKFGVTVEQWMAFVGAVDVPTPPEGQDADGTETR